jgi:hypothetical protein
MLRPSAPTIATRATLIVVMLMLRSMCFESSKPRNDFCATTHGM